MLENVIIPYDLKLVKNSVAIMSDDEFVCKHHNTVIFHAVKGFNVNNEPKWIVKTLDVPSNTSSKMAKRCLEYLRINDDWKKLKELFHQ